MSAKNAAIREIVLDSPMPNFSGELITEKDVARVFMWYENQNRALSPGKILEGVTTLLREHVTNLGKKVQTPKQVGTKVFRVIEKVKSLDKFTRVLENPTKWVPIKKALFRKNIDIEQNSDTKPDVAKVRINDSKMLQKNGECKDFRAKVPDSMACR